MTLKQSLITGRFFNKNKNKINQGIVESLWIITKQPPPPPKKKNSRWLHRYLDLYNKNLMTQTGVRDENLQRAWTLRALVFIWMSLLLLVGSGLFQYMRTERIAWKFVGNVTQETETKLRNRITLQWN